MKPSHLAAIMLASCTGVLTGSPANTALQTQSVQNHSSKHAVIQKTESRMIFEQAMRGSTRIECIAASWKKLNQRQIRKNRRRSFAAGNRKAFK